LQHITHLNIQALQHLSFTQTSNHKEETEVSDDEKLKYQKYHDHNTAKK